MTVIHWSSSWLPLTQYWMYDQVRFLPAEIDTHIVCGHTENLAQFTMPNIHSLSDGSRWQYFWHKAIRKLGIQNHSNFLVEQAIRLNAHVLHSHFGNVGWENLAVVRRTGLKHVVSFYGYDTEFVASANTGLEKSNTSILFIYRDENGIVSLVMIHDITNDESGGKAVFEFSGVPDGTDFVVRDDGGASEAVLPVSTWLWADCCTDGGALNGSLGQAFAMTIVPDFPEEGGLTEGKIDAWTFLTGVLENPTSIDLDLTTAVTIRRLTP